MERRKERREEEGEKEKGKEGRKDGEGITGEGVDEEEATEA